MTDVDLPDVPASDWPGVPLPAKFTTIKGYQARASQDVVDAWASGVDVVILNAPTGSGKTIISELVRRQWGGARSTFICHSLTLQDQFLADFDYARALKGRSNYPTERSRLDVVSCADCTGQDCSFCDSKATCPYMAANREAVAAPVSVLNISYMLTRQPTQQGNGKVSDPFMRDVMTVDECDVLEAALMGHLEFRIGSRMLGRLGVSPPVKAARKKTLAAWLEDDLAPAARAESDAIARETQGRMFGVPDVAAIKRAREGKRLAELADKALVVAEQLEDGAWVRDYDRDEGNVVLKPVTVHDQAPAALWDRGKRRGTKWLCMSGTVISPDEWARSTGVDAAGLSWELVDVPMTFPKRNRPVVIKAAANMARSGGPGEFDKLVRSVIEILDKYPDSNTLVHTVSYTLMRDLVAALRREGRRGVISYETSRDRDLALKRFTDGGGCIVAPSLDRGVDLPGDLCRVAIVAKVPFPYLGDRQVSERMHLPDGGLWYACQTARSIVQMTGRGVRHSDDWCVTYVLDANFAAWFRKWGGRLLPRWWVEAITNENAVDLPISASS